MAIFTFPRKIIFQRDIIEDLSEILNNEGVTKALLITDSVLFNIYKTKIEKIFKDIEYKVYDGVKPEPTIESVEEGFRECQKFNPDFVIALGGGSVIDFAKSLALKLSYPNLNLREVSPFESLKLSVKLIAIPTTSGTGSDVTFGIVLTDYNSKRAMGNYDLVPAIDILDSSLTPKNRELIRNTGIDALVHAFEALSANTATILTDALAEKAIDTIFKNLKSAMDNEEEAKEHMHLAATMAGLAFSNSGTALAHAMGHSFGATFHIVHGVSVALFLPYVIQFNAQDDKARQKYLKIARDLNLTSVDDLVSFIKDFYLDLGQAATVKDLNIDRELYDSHLEELTAKAMQDNEIVFNPIFVSDDDVCNLFKQAYDGG